MAVLETLLQITIYSAIIFTAIMLVKVCFKNKISPFLQYVVWGIFLLRLMFPVTIESSVHLITLPVETPISTEVTAQSAQQDTFDLAPSSSGSYAKQQNAANLENIAAPAESVEQSGNSATVAKRAIRLTWPQILLIVWLAGITVCLCYFAALAVLLKKRFIKRPTVPSAHLLTLFGQVKDELGIRTKLKVLYQDDCGTPALLFPRTIFLPIRTLAPMDDEQIRNCIRHECMHYKRRDHILNLLLLLLNAVYWFNPIVWLAFFQIRRDVESACDSAVVRHMNPYARRDYATLILGMFSQEKPRQIALGMVQDGTKKIAAERIRGIFMKNNSRKSVRLTMVILAVVLFAGCFTTACQPTPEEAVVIGKGDGLSGLIQSTPDASGGASPIGTPEQTNDVLYEKLGAPKHWSLDTTALDDRLNITAEVDLELPGVSQLPAATASLSALTQEDLDKVAEVFGAGGAEWMEIDHTMTKEQIMEEIIDHQARRAQFEAEGNDELVEKMDEDIKDYEQMYQDAPDKIELQNIAFQIGKISYGEELNGDEITGVGFEGTTQVDGQPLYFNAGSNVYGDSVNWVQASFGSQYNGFGGVDVDAPYGVSLTKEQAAQQASDIASQLTDELKLCYITPAASGQKDVSRNWGWACVFMREINGCPTAYETTENGFRLEAVSVPVNYEKIIIVMDDAGIVSFFWGVPMTIESIDNPDVSLLSFDKISQRAIEKITQIHADDVVEDIGSDGIDWGDPGCTANIISVKLGLTRVAKANSDDFYYIPVWKFFVDLVHTDEYNERTGTKDLSLDYFDEDGNPTDVLYSNTVHEYDYARGCNVITLNALDGSVIDNDLGY